MQAVPIPPPPIPAAKKKKKRTPTWVQNFKLNIILNRQESEFQLKFVLFYSFISFSCFYHELFTFK